MRQLPIVIVGAGIAGVTVALSVRDRPVLLITRGDFAMSGATRYAQGGIAAPWLPTDSSEIHASDTITAGSGVNCHEAVEVLTKNAREAIHWLIGHGVQFDQDGGEYRLCLEGGHSTRRILHAGGDLSGKAILSPLAAQAAGTGHISVREHMELDALMLRGDCVTGIRVRSREGRVEQINAAAVVLATGGIGALFQWTTNPPECDGSGLAIAMAAGARVSDLEFVQFHPTVLRVGAAAQRDQCALVSEAVRGAGATLIDDLGRRLMDDVHELKDLAPRDTVAREVWRAQQSGRNVFLDARCVGGRWPERFPTIFASCMGAGFDPRVDAIPVTPAAHFHMGGVAVDLNGETSIPGLYAVGEVACNGVHGANRLASNSLLEGVVFGRRIGAVLSESLPIPARGISEAIGADALDPHSLSLLRGQAWTALGPERDPHTITQFLDFLETRPELSRTRQGIVISAVARAALARKEPLGGHFVKRASDNAAGHQSPRELCLELVK